MHLELELPSRLDDCLPSHCLVKLLKNLAMPLGLKGHPDAIDAKGNINHIYFVRFINSLMLKQDMSGKVYFVDVIYALLRSADKTMNASGNYTFFSMQQKHDFLRNLSQIYKKRVVLTLKKKLQHEHFESVDILRQIQSVRAIQACYCSSKLRHELSPSSSSRCITEASLRILKAQSSIFNFRFSARKKFFQAFETQSASSTSDESSEDSCEYSSSDDESTDYTSSNDDDSDSSSHSSDRASRTEEAMWSEIERQFMGVKKEKGESLMLPQLVATSRIKEYHELKRSESGDRSRSGENIQRDEEKKDNEEEVWHDFSTSTTASPKEEPMPSSVRDSLSKGPSYRKLKSNFSIDQCDHNDDHEVDAF